LTAIVLFVVLSFSLFVTVHVVGSVALARRQPRWSGAVAFVVPPYFPVCAVRRHAPGWAIAWCATALAYAVSLSVAVGWK
jgi:hypothetical protein